jgi:hypothetical protein
MRTDRLYEFIDLLEADAVNPKGSQFNLNFWAAPSGTVDRHTQSHLRSESLSFYKADTKVIAVDCGTTVCALGLLAVSGIFKDEGFTFKIDSDGTLFPKYGNKTGFEAATAFFELPKYADQMESRDYVAYLLFDPCYYERKTGKDAELEVVRRIRLLISHGTLSLDIIG